jgi:excisionase family DNA binding protein
VIEQLLTPGDVAERCQVSTKTVLRAIHRGRLRASRLGEHGAFRIREADVERWIEASVLEVSMPAREIAVPVPAAPALGRLVLAPDMGRSTEGVSFGSPSL